MDLSKFKMLEEIPMMLLRPDTFIGAVETRAISSYIFEDANAIPVFRQINYSPALLKLFDEVLQNCYDHSKRPEGKHLTKIEVTINAMNGMITISDNAGIPVVQHPDYNMLLPCMIFGQLRSSSNYDDSEAREGGGRNGLGSKLTNIFSTYFKVETADGKNRYEKVYEDNRQKETEPKVNPTRTKGTQISFIPDYERLKCTLDKDNYGMIVTRIYEVAACAPGIDVYLNGKKIDVKGFEKFVEKFGKEYLFIQNENWRIGIHSSGEDGFKHISFVNAVHTTLGGTHVEYVADQLVEGVREHIKKKTKQDIKPADIKNHFLLMVDCTVHNPKFSSQTKDYMNLPISEYGTKVKLDEAFFKKLLKSKIIEQIVEWAVNRQKLKEMQEKNALSKAAAKASRKDIDKYEPATQKTNREECTLFICEGDSAANPLISARDPKKHGVFALRGKPLNLGDAKLEQIKKNTEIQNLMAALGLEFGKPAKDLRYGKIVLSTDADMDGMHIRALSINNFYHEWKDVLEKGMIYFLHTPIIRVKQGKEVLEFFTEEEFEAWAKVQKKPYTQKYIKGLGGHSTADFKKYMFEDQFQIPVEFSDEEDEKMLQIAFGDSDKKKPWLDLE